MFGLRQHVSVGADKLRRENTKRELALMLNCKQASELISHALDEKLTLYQWLGVRLRLIYRALCRRYQRQLNFVRAAARKLASGAESDELKKLSPQARHRIREAIKKRLDQKGRKC